MINLLNPNEMVSAVGCNFENQNEVILIKTSVQTGSSFTTIVGALKKITNTVTKGGGGGGGGSCILMGGVEVVEGSSV